MDLARVVPAGMKAMGRLAREPLVGFFLVGALLFALDAMVAPGRAAKPDERVIEVSAAEVGALARRHRATTGRDATEGELDALVRRHVRDRVLAEEARAAGLDLRDQVVERRLVQKMEYLLAGAVEVAAPTDADLEERLRADSESYTQPARVAFEHIFFAPGGRADPRADAQLARERLAAGDDPARLGDGFVHGRIVRSTPVPVVGERFGATFAMALEGLPRHEWAGPLEGRAGLHLVRVTSWEPARMPALEEVRAAVARDLEREARARATRAAIERRIDRYRVRVEELPR